MKKRKILYLNQMRDMSINDIISLYIQGYRLQGTNIRIGHQRTDLHLAVFVADELKLFDNYGITTILNSFGSGPVEMASMGSGSIDIAYVGTYPALTYIDRNLNTNQSAHIISGAQTSGIGIIVKKDSTIRSIFDLKGKKIAVLAIGSIQDITLRNVLIKDGISPEKDIEIIPIDIASIPDAVSTGFTDAGYTAQPFVSQAVIEKDCRVLAWVDDILSDNQKNMFINIVAAKDDFIRNNSEMVHDFLKIHNEATQYIKNNSESAAQIAHDKLYISLDVEIDSLKYINFSTLPSQQDIDRIIAFSDDLYRKQILKNKLTKDDIFDLRYSQ